MARGGIGNTLGSGPRDSWFESRRANLGRRWVSAWSRARRPAPNRLDGWPSGLRRTPGERVGALRLVGSNPTPSVSVRRCDGAAVDGKRWEDRWEKRATQASSTDAPSTDAPNTEGWQNGNAPHSKCGALTGLWVRIPPPPFLSRRGFRPIEVSEAAFRYWGVLGRVLERAAALS